MEIDVGLLLLENSYIVNATHPLTGCCGWEVKPDTMSTTMPRNMLTKPLPQQHVQRRCPRNIHHNNNFKVDVNETLAKASRQASKQAGKQASKQARTSLGPNLDAEIRRVRVNCICFVKIPRAAQGHHPLLPHSLRAPNSPALPPHA